MYKEKLHSSRWTRRTHELLELIRVVLPYLDSLEDRFTKKERDLMRSFLAAEGSRIPTAIAVSKAVKTVDNNLLTLCRKLKVYVGELDKMKKKAGREDEEIICPHCHNRFRRMRKE